MRKGGTLNIAEICGARLRKCEYKIFERNKIKSGSLFVYVHIKKRVYAKQMKENHFGYISN